MCDDRQLPQALNLFRQMVAQSHREEQMPQLGSPYKYADKASTAMDMDEDLIERNDFRCERLPKVIILQSIVHTA
jgi:hypothetical protein